jgi:hypothetical protein
LLINAVKMITTRNLMMTTIQILTMSISRLKYNNSKKEAGRSDAVSLVIMLYIRILCKKFELF